MKGSNRKFRDLCRSSATMVILQMKLYRIRCDIICSNIFYGHETHACIKVCSQDRRNLRGVEYLHVYIRCWGWIISNNVWVAKHCWLNHCFSQINKKERKIHLNVWIWQINSTIHAVLHTYIWFARLWSNSRYTVSILLPPTSLRLVWIKIICIHIQFSFIYQ